MPKFDLTVTISVIIAICAIISPVLTTIINNRYQYKIHKLEAQQQKYENSTVYLQRIFEKYLETAGRCISHPQTVFYYEYSQQYFVALLYASKPMQEIMIDIHRLMENKKWN